VQQLFSTSRPLWIASGVLLLLALIPGLPKISFLLIAALLIYGARRVARTKAAEAAPETKPDTKSPTAPELLEGMLKLDEISLEVGYALVPLVDAQQGGQLLPRVRSLRSHLALQLGFIIPSVHITDNLRLKPQEYVISLRGVEVARWELKEQNLLAISSDVNGPKIPGIETREPAFGVTAYWIQAGQRDQALCAGYAVVDHTSLLATHLGEVIRNHAHEILTRHETKRLCDRLSESHPKLVEELVPKLLSLGEVQRVLQQLLREHVSIRDLATILEALVDSAAVNRNPVLLVETARQALGRALVRPLLTEEGQLKVITIEPGMEEELERAFGSQSGVSGTAMQPSFARRLLEGLRRLAGEQVAITTPVLLCSSPARFHLRRLLEPFLPKLVILSPLEIPPLVHVHSVGTVP
jgi:flagellar biosynthesis protein FlhA